jgi:hypothetical protein
MSTQDYRPSIGEALFVTLYSNDPVLITVTGYHFDDRFTSEQIDYIEKGKQKSTSITGMKFHPEVPIDTKFFYTVMVEENAFMDRPETTKLGVFFNPEDAFEFLDGIESGSIKPEHVSSHEFVDYFVTVEKL